MSASLTSQGRGADKGGWRPGDRGQVAVVAFSHAIQHSYVAVLGIAYPFVLADFGASYAVLGLFLGAASLMGALMQGMAGLVKRASTRLLLGAQNAAIGLVTAIAALSPGIVFFGAARVMGSFVTWPQHPIGSAHLTERVPHRRGFVLAAHFTGGNLGTLVTPLVAGAIIAGVGWRWTLACFAIFMAASSLLTLSRLDPVLLTAGVTPDTDATDTDEPGAATVDADTATADTGEPDTTTLGTGEPETGKPEAVRLRRALRSRQAVAVLAAGTISAAGRGLGVLTTYVPAYLRDGLGKSAVLIGVLVAVMTAGAILGPLICGQLSDRVSRRGVLLTLYGGGAISLAWFVLVGGSPYLLAIVGLAVGVFTASEQPIRQALFSDAMKGVPPRAAFGAFFAISQSLGAVWLTALGAIITYVGFQAAFGTMAVSFVVAGAVIAVLYRDPTRGSGGDQEDTANGTAPA